jgi:hypothetical protein
MYGFCGKLVFVKASVFVKATVFVIDNIKDSSLKWNLSIFHTLRIRNIL